MTEEYKPKLTEIVSEMSKGLGSYVKDSWKKGLKEAGKAIVYFPVGLVKGVVTRATFLYYIPTYVRIKDRFDYSDNFAFEKGEMIGAAVGWLSYIAQFACYHAALDNNLPEIAAIPIATNVVSGIGELVNSWVSRAKERVEIRHWQQKWGNKKESLEKCVDGGK